MTAPSTSLPPPGGEMDIITPGTWTHFSPSYTSERERDTSTMVKAATLYLLLAHFLPSALLTTDTEITVYPKRSVYGVFQAMHSEGYTFNASAARDVCQLLGVSIADKSQVEYALKRGFETCKYGWVDEQVAIIPRITINPNCGKGGVGMITWRAELSSKFGVFCFNSTEFTAQVLWASLQPQTSTEASPPSTTSNPRFKTTPTIGPLYALNTPEEVGEPQAYSSQASAIGAGLIISLATIFGFMTVLVVAVLYFKLRRFCFSGTGEQQGECIEAEVCGEDVEASTADTMRDEDIGIHVESEDENAATS